jgi:hypothetical protein
MGGATKNLATFSWGFSLYIAESEIDTLTTTCEKHNSDQEKVSALTAGHLKNKLVSGSEEACHLTNYWLMTNEVLMHHPIPFHKQKKSNKWVDDRLTHSSNQTPPKRT